MGFKDEGLVNVRACESGGPKVGEVMALGILRFGT